MKHTPGPWFVRHTITHGVHVNFLGRDDREWAVCNVWATSGNQEADARLISAAPALLEACQKARNWLDALPDAPMEPGERELIDTLEVAIYQAMGQHPRPMLDEEIPF